MFQSLFGGMTKFRVISFAILLYLSGVLLSVVHEKFNDSVILFCLLIVLRFLLECKTPIDKSHKRK